MDFFCGSLGQAFSAYTIARRNTAAILKQSEFLAGIVWCRARPENLEDAVDSLSEGFEPLDNTRLEVEGGIECGMFARAAEVESESVDSDDSVTGLGKATDCLERWRTTPWGISYQINQYRTDISEGL